MTIFYYSIHPRYKTELLFKDIACSLFTSWFCRYHPEGYVNTKISFWSILLNSEQWSRAFQNAWLLHRVQSGLRYFCRHGLKFQFWLVSPWWGSQLSPTVQKNIWHFRELLHKKLRLFSSAAYFNKSIIMSVVKNLVLRKKSEKVRLIQSWDQVSGNF